jgi:hypothetical protein
MIILFYFHMESVKMPSKSTRLYDWPPEIKQAWTIKRDQLCNFWSLCGRCPIFKAAIFSVSQGLQSTLKSRFLFLWMEMWVVVFFRHIFLYSPKSDFYLHYGHCEFVKIFKNVWLQVFFPFTKEWYHYLCFHLRSILLTI